MLKSKTFNAMVLRGGRVIDPSTGRDEVADIAIEDGKIVSSDPSDAIEIDAKGLIVCPGLMDIHVHLREPGQTHKEDIATGTAAAAAGGFTFVACMPNTQPTLDQVDVIQSVIKRANEINLCEVGPVGCITQKRMGDVLAGMAELKKSGVVAFSDDGTGVEKDNVMRAAFELAKEIDTVLIQHCEYKAISDGGVMHKGEVSDRLGLPGLDPRSEEDMIERDIALCRETGGRYHVAHISTARAVEMVRRARAEGLPVTSEVCTHHLVLTDEACDMDDPNTKMHPPLRPRGDVDACRQGLLDGTIDCIVTDHAPHTMEEKNVGFLKAPPGIVGLETAVGLAALAMLETGLADWPGLIKWFTTGAAKVLRSEPPTLSVGNPVNLTVVDPHGHWVVDPEKFASKGRNTPFSGWKLPARAIGTIRYNSVNFLKSSRLDFQQ